MFFFRRRYSILLHEEERHQALINKYRDEKMESGIYDSAPKARSNKITVWVLILKNSDSCRFGWQLSPLPVVLNALARDGDSNLRIPPGVPRIAFLMSALDSRTSE